MLHLVNEQAAEHLAEVIKTAAGMSTEALDTLLIQLEYLRTYAYQFHEMDKRTLTKETRCLLGKDFAPHSFSFMMQQRVRNEGRPSVDYPEWSEFENWFNGGLIYSGPGVPSDGSFPSLTVDVVPSEKVHDWRVHT